jgi:hypothetical protein
MRMGRAIQVDRARSMVLLDDGTWVQVSPRTRMRLNGQDSRTQTAIVPGDELLIVVSGSQPRAGERSAVTAGRNAGQQQQQQAAASPSPDPSALARESLVDRWDTVQADEVHIFRRHQSP